VVVRLNRKAETVGDRRISREEEKRILEAAPAIDHLGTSRHGAADTRRIIGALELRCRLR